MQTVSKAIFLSTLLFFSTVVDSRRVKVGSPPRGSSSARTHVAAGRPPSSGGGFQTGGGAPPHQVPVHQGGYPNQPRPGQPAGGYHPNQPIGGGVRPGQGYGHPGGFNTGSGPGSVSRGSQFKTALAAGALGAVGGIVTYELGKAIINSASHPFHINDRPYYFDEKNYKQTSGQFMCSMPLDELIKQTAQGSTTTAAPSTVSEGVVNETTATHNEGTTTPSPDKLLSNIQYKDGSRPKTIVWSCKTGTEVCCGTECCVAPPQVSTGDTNSAGHSSGTSYAGIAFGILVAILLMMCCCCCLAYRFFRSAFDSCLPTSKYNDDDNANVTYTSNKYATDATTVFSEYPQQPLQQQGYPSAQPGVGYVPSGQHYNYPSQAGAGPQQYPAYPHNY